MDIKEIEDHISSVENANFILLSLYREYSEIIRKNPTEKEKYSSIVEQIKKDLKYTESKELINKVELFYLPKLQKILKKD